MPSLRWFTKEQFSEGTTIDGSRLEKALQDLEEWSNDIKDGQFKQRWMQSQLIMKYLPPTIDSDATLAAVSTIAGNFRRAPFLPIYNGPKDENPFRLKGTALSYHSGYTAPSYTYFPNNDPPVYTPDIIYNDQVVWTSALALGEEPVIIDSVDLVLLTYDGEYVSDWKYGAGAPPGRGAGEFVNDIQLEITMDNPFLPNLQEKNSVLYHKYLFSAESALFSPEPISLGAITKDMVPSLNSVSGMVPLHSRSVALTMSDLNIPVPPYSRLRLSLILPFISNTPWNSRPWRTGIPTVNMTILERLRDG